MKRGGPILWLILAVATGLSIPPVVMIIDELTGHAVPEVNPLFIGGIALVWLVAVWALVLICVAVQRKFVRIPVLVLMLVPYAALIQDLGDQAFFLVTHSAGHGDRRRLFPRESGSRSGSRDRRMRFPRRPTELRFPKDRRAGAGGERQ